MQLYTMVVVMKTVPEDQAPTFIGIMEGMRTLGVVIGPLYGGPLYTAGGWYLPYLILGLVMIPLGFSVSVVGSWLPPRVTMQKTSMEKRRELSIPPIIALMYTTMMVMAPSVIMAPTIEVYLVASPFEMTTDTISGLLGGLSAIDIIAAGLSGPAIQAVGEWPVIIGASICLVTGQVILAFGPRQLGFVVLGSLTMSLGFYPNLVAYMGLFRRICKTYLFDFKEMSDVYASMVLVLTSAASAVFMVTGGAIADGIGFRSMYAIFSGISLTVFLAYYIGFHPRLMGRPLATYVAGEDEVPTKVMVEEEPRKSSFCLSFC